MENSEGNEIFLESGVKIQKIMSIFASALIERRL